MKIEDINYDLSAVQINEEDFNKEQWLLEHPVDYFKFLYLLLKIPDNLPNKMANNIPRELTTDIVFELLYPVTRLYIPDTLYKFYSFTNDDELNQKKLSTLRNRQIFMSDIKDFNDPFDGKAFYYNPRELKDIKRLAPHNGKFIDDFTTFIKGAAFTENDTSCMPMWAHYSNNHQGYCVAYDMNNPDNQNIRSCTFKIQYTDQRLDITSFMREYANTLSSAVDRFISYGIKRIPLTDRSIVYIAQFLFNVKQSTWSYEKEYRCSMGTLNTKMPFVNAIPKAIYIGLNCSEKNRKELINIAKEQSIPIYQMKFNELSENYKLEEILLHI